MEISAIQSDREFTELKETWNKLLSKSDTDSIFLSWEWTYACWKNFRDNEELLILIFKENGREIVGIAPLYIRDIRFLCFPFRLIGFIGDRESSSEYLNFIIKRGNEEKAIKEFLRYLDKNTSWDTIILKEIPEVSVIPKYLEAFSCDRQYIFKHEKKICSAVPMLDNWELQLKSLKPKFRREICSYIKRLEKDFRTDLSVCTDKDDIETILHVLFELHQKLWTSKGFEGSFSNSVKRQFYGDICHLFYKQGWLRLYLMRLNDKIVACQIGFEYNNRYFYLQGGFDPDYGDKNVGTVFISYILKDLISKGIKEFDFLGDFAQYKRDWEAVPKYSIKTSIGKPNLKNELYFYLPLFKEGIREMFEKALPKKLVEYRRKYLAWRREKKVRKNAH